MPDEKKCAGPCQRVLALDPEYFRRDASQSRGFKPRCKQCEPKRGRRVSDVDGDGSIDVDFGDLYEDGLPVPAVPDGFSVRDVSSQLDEQGNLEKQWIGARRDGDVYEKIQAALPSGHGLKGVSTLLDEKGNVRAQWVKTSKNRDSVVDVLAAFAAIKDELPVSDGPITPPTNHLDKDLLATYLMGDSHVGMYAWGPEAGSDYDLKTAERNLTGLVDHLVDLAPSAANALIINIGDYFHSDNRGSTTTAGTPVDVDGRWAKVLAVGIRIMRRNIERALQKHAQVTVINEIGNHDTHTSVFLALALAQFYEDEPRVKIDVSPELFHWFRFGKVLVGTHHGHTVKPKDLPLVMANDRSEDWGETEYRYFYGGHIHHERVIEFPGVIFESLRSPASTDAWHRGQGYRSGHDIKMDVLHREYGRISRCIVDVPRMLGRAA